MLSQKHSACILTAVLLLASASGCSVKTDNTASADPLTITVWTYYNGDQLELFNKLVSEFNDTTGRSLGIIVESSSQGTVNDLETNVLASANGEVGASDMPNIFSAYADTAYTLDQMGLVMDLSDYLTKEERLAYIDNYLDEGDFSGDGSIKIFPVAKSTELLFLNDTDWRAFSDATGASYEDLSTIEGLVSTAEMYYNWTDEQTPEKMTDVHCLEGMQWPTIFCSVQNSLVLLFSIQKTEKCLSILIRRSCGSCGTIITFLM